MNETILGTIHCKANKATVEALLFSCGLRAESSGSPNHFDVVNGGRDSEPEVDQDLWELALTKLRAAEREGAISSWSVVS